MPEFFILYLPGKKY